MSESAEDRAEKWWAQRNKWDEIVHAKIEELGGETPEFHTWLCEVQEWRHALEAQDSVNDTTSG